MKNFIRKSIKKIIIKLIKKISNDDWFDLQDIVELEGWRREKEWTIQLNY